MRRTFTENKSRHTNQRFRVYRSAFSEAFSALIRAFSALRAPLAPRPLGPCNPSSVSGLSSLPLIFSFLFEDLRDELFIIGPFLTFFQLCSESFLGHPP